MSRRIPRQSTIPGIKPPRTVRPGPPPRVTRQRTMPPKRQVARLIDQGDTSLVDVIDNLLYRGVVVNADLVLALANVDLVYVRLFALLCAADRVMSRERR